MPFGHARGLPSVCCDRCFSTGIKSVLSVTSLSSIITPHDSAANMTRPARTNFSRAYRACAGMWPKLDTVTLNTFCPLISFPQPYPIQRKHRALNDCITESTNTRGCVTRGVCSPLSSISAACLNHPPPFPTLSLFLSHTRFVFQWCVVSLSLSLSPSPSPSPSLSISLSLSLSISISISLSLSLLLSLLSSHLSLSLSSLSSLSSHLLSLSLSLCHSY